MRLLHIVSSMDPRAGGPSQNIRNFCSHSREHAGGKVVCLDDPKSDYLVDEPFSVEALGKGVGRWSYHHALRPWLERSVSSFDGVILHGLWQYPGYALARVARQPDMPPYYVFPHGMLDPWFQSAPGRRLKALRNWLYWKLVERHVISGADTLFFTCAEEMRLAQKTFRPFQPKRQLIVGLGVPQPPSHRPSMVAAFAQKCPKIKARPYLLFLGRIHPKKGVDILIRAYAKIAATESTPLTALVIAGPGTETPYGQEMIALVDKTCPPGSVCFPGMLTGDAKWGALYGAEAFALASHQENFGIAVAESLACGTPVLISNQVNICREIEEDKAGFVSDDTLSGAHQLLRQWLALSREEAMKMRRSALNCYETRFEISRAAATLRNAIAPLLPSPAAGVV